VLSAIKAGTYAGISPYIKGDFATAYMEYKKQQ